MIAKRLRTAGALNIIGKDVEATSEDIVKTLDLNDRLKDKTAESIPEADYNQTYTANSTICSACNGTPHGLPDYIIEPDGKIKAKINPIPSQYNPDTKTVIHERNDPIPVKPQSN